MTTLKPYNSIRIFLAFIERLGEAIMDELWTLADHPYEKIKNLYVYADPETYNFAICEKHELPQTKPHMPLKKFCTFSYNTSTDAESILNWHTLLQFAKLVIPEGTLALKDFSLATKAYQERLSRPYNEIEDDYNFRQIESTVDIAATQLCRLRGDDEYSDKIFQSIKKVLLKERYFIEWKTDEELYGHPEYSPNKLLIESSQIKGNEEYQKTSRVIYMILNDFFRSDRNSLFGREAAYRCCERIFEVLFCIKWEPPKNKET